MRRTRQQFSTSIKSFCVKYWTEFRLNCVSIIFYIKKRLIEEERQQQKEISKEMMNLSRKGTTHTMSYFISHFLRDGSRAKKWTKFSYSFFVSSIIKCLSLFRLLSFSLCFFWFTTERFVARKLRCEYCSINFLTLKMSNFYGILTLNDKLTWQKKIESKRVRMERKRGKQTCWLCHSNDFLKFVQGLLVDDLHRWKCWIGTLTLLLLDVPNFKSLRLFCFKELRFEVS